jgi:hypothetical protein
MSTERQPLKVFLSYASQDRPAVREIYDALKVEEWIDPWLDQEKILPGQNWRIVIETAVDEADVVIICLSHQSVTKEGYVQREIKYAYETALEKPEGTIFLIPLRLDDCDIPRELQYLQRVDYFGVEKAIGYADLLDALKVRYEQKSGIISNYRKQQAESIPSGTDAQLEPQPATSPKKQETNQIEEVRRRVDPAVIAGILAIIAALIPVFANLFSPSPTSTPTITVPPVSTVTHTAIITATATPNTPTLTPVPATDTPLPTPTGVPPVPLGEDWTEGCISTLWKLYPADEITVTDRGDGCWYEPVYVFQAENGDLDVLAQDRNEELKIYGLFARLPESGRVNVTVRLNELTNVDLWLGIFAEQDVTSQGLLMTIPNGNVLKRVIVQKDPRTNETITDTSLLDQGSGFSFSFIFNANSARSVLNPSVFFTESVPIPSSQKWLFLGYKSLIGYYRIEGRFLEFELE